MESIDQFFVLIKGILKTFDDVIGRRVLIKGHNQVGR